MYSSAACWSLPWLGCGFISGEVGRVEMREILALRSRVSREEALAAFQPGGITGAVQLKLAGPLRSVAEVYVPFRLFRAIVHDGA